MNEDKINNNDKESDKVAKQLKDFSDLYVRVIEAYDTLRVVMDSEASAENGKKNGNGTKDKVAGKAVDKIVDLSQALYDAGHGLACMSRQLTSERKKTDGTNELIDGLVAKLGYTGVSAEGEKPAIKGTPIWYERLGIVVYKTIQEGAAAISRANGLESDITNASKDAEKYKALVEEQKGYLTRAAQKITELAEKAKEKKEDQNGN